MPQYLAILDANALYTKKPEVFSPAAVKLIGDCRRLVDIDFFVPDVVRMELSYQQCRLATAAAANLRKNIETFSSAIGRDLPGPPEPGQIKDQAESHVAEMLGDVGVGVLPAPVADIDWATVIADACWRRSVFEPPPDEEPRWEKGFRDRLILETVLHAAAMEKARQIVFITDDRLTAKIAAEKAKGGGVSITCYAELVDLKSAIELTKKTKSKEFSNAAVSEAPGTFYRQGDPGCLFIAGGLKQALFQQFGPGVRNPVLIPALFAPESPLSKAARTISTPLYGPLRASSPLTYEPRWGLRMDIGATSYVPSSGDRYGWQTEIEIAALFKPKGGGGPLPSSDVVSIQKIDVEWTCRIASDTAEISDARVQEITRRGLPLVKPADATIKFRYGWPFYDSAPLVRPWHDEDLLLDDVHHATSLESEMAIQSLG